MVSPSAVPTYQEVVGLVVDRAHTYAQTRHLAAAAGMVGGGEGNEVAVDGADIAVLGVDIARDVDWGGEDMEVVYPAPLVEEDHCGISLSVARLVLDVSVALGPAKV